MNTYITTSTQDVSSISLKFSKTRDVQSPIRGTSLSAGIDFFIPNDFAAKTLKPNDNILIPSGIKVNIPKGFALIAFNKSGVSTKKHLYVGACVVDEDYQGEIHIHLTNVGKSAATVSPGEKIIQFILIPVSYSIPEEVELKELYPEISKRGEGGFGSTDK